MDPFRIKFEPILDPFWTRFGPALDPFRTHFGPYFSIIYSVFGYRRSLWRFQLFLRLDLGRFSKSCCGIHQKYDILKAWSSNLGVCELIFDFKKLFSYTNCTELNIQFLKSINEESKRTDDDLDKIMSSGMVLVNNILNGSDESVSQQRASPIDERFGLN